MIIKCNFVKHIKIRAKLSFKEKIRLLFKKKEKVKELSLKEYFIKEYQKCPENYKELFKDK